jgi:hypothetical protein
VDLEIVDQALLGRRHGADFLVCRLPVGPRDFLLRPEAEDSAE